MEHGDGVWTFGYPYPEIIHTGEDKSIYQIDGRLLRGYVTRHFTSKRTGQPAGAYELDMRAPQGLSGAPLLRHGTDQVAGVICAENDRGTVTAFASIDPETGDHRPMELRTWPFAEACDTEALCALRTSATRNTPLKNYLLSQGLLNGSERA